MKLSNVIISIALVASTAAGCKKDFLDREITTQYNEDEVFVNYDRMSKTGLGVYSSMLNRFGFNRISNAMLASACDEADHANPLSSVHLFNVGVWNASTNPEDCWSGFYEGIRRANLFLENSADYKNILFRDTILPANKTQYQTQVRDIEWMRAEARLLRAFYHFELMKRYGGVAIMDKVIDDEEILKNIKRQSSDSCVSFIANECDAVAPLLKDTWVGFDGDKWRGRLTQGTALALKSRVLLYGASPLNNPSNDLDKWQKAATAANDLIALSRYSLFNDYSGLFKLGNGADGNAEVIFAIQGWNRNDYEIANYPIGYDKGGQNSTSPTQNLVDAYEMKSTGRPITDKVSKYDPTNPYNDRDPRLAASVLLNNTTFKGRKVECWVGGLDGLGKTRATTTGYYIRKYENENLNLVNNESSVHAWILFRYAEVLLNYAEAMNEANGPEVRKGNVMTAKAAVDLVRQRAGMPVLPAGVSQDALRERIRNERRVELAFEEHRFFDVRRWKIAEQTENAPIMAMRIIKNGDGSFNYTVVKAEDRVFYANKMYLYPIPEAEVLKGAITQNPNW